MNKRMIWAIARKDIRAITSNVQIWLGMILLPLIFCVVLPGGVILFGKMFDITMFSGIDILKTMIMQMPEGDLKEMILQFPSERHQIIYVFVNYMMVPLFLAIPIFNVSIIAANSFVGEKERRTLESLLFAPIDIKSLFMGKVYASFIPGIVISLLSFLLCGIVITSLTYSMYDSLIFPNWNWIVMILWITPILSFTTILITVLISARVKGFQEAQQLSGILVLPIIILVISQVSGLFLLGPKLLLLFGGILLFFNLILMHRVGKLNQRELLFEKQVH